jgi:hypothetical protein
MTATRTRAVRVAATSARVLTGAVVAAACVAGTVAALAAPLPGISHEPAQVAVTPPPGDTVLVCNGDFRALGRDTASPLQMQSAEAPRLTVGQSHGEPETTALSVPDLPGAGQVRRLTGVAEGREAPLLAATESLTLSAGDLAGFAAAPCREARTESWLIGGSVQTGAEDVIVLTNPGAVPATVTLTVYGATRGASTSIVPAGTQVALPLTSIAAGATAPVVKVSATGAPVRAVLQSSLTRTLDPVGIDLQDAVSGPQQHPVIPGVRVHDEEGDSSTAAIVRMLSPDADTSAVVTVRAVGQTAAAMTYPVDLVAGQPLEVSLADLAPGDYTVSVDADRAVLAGLREEDGAGPGSDFAWALPAPAIADDVLVAIPAGPSAVLHLVNDDDQDAVVTVARADGGGAPQEVTVPAGSSASVAVQPRTVVSLTPSAPVHASVAMSAAGALAVWPVWPGAGAEKSITVYP